MAAGPFRDDYLILDRSDVQLAAAKASVWRETQTVTAPNGEQYSYSALMENTPEANAAVVDHSNRILRLAADETKVYRIVDAIPHDTLPHIELFLTVVR